MPNTIRIMDLGDKSCSVRSAEAEPLPLNVPNDSLMPSAIGLASIISVHTAAIPMVPAPMKRTFSFQSCMAKAVMSMSDGCGMMLEKYGTAPPQAIKMPTRMAMPPVSPTR